MDNDLLLTALGYARDTATQVLSLATGIIAVSITLSRDVFKTGTRGEQALATGTWAMLLISVLTGVLALHSITGNVAVAAGGLGLEAPADAGRMLLSPYDFKVRLFVSLQLLTFLAANGMLVWFGILKLRRPKQEAPRAEGT